MGHFGKEIAFISLLQRPFAFLILFLLFMQILEGQKCPVFLSSQVNVAGYDMIFPVYPAETLYRIPFIPFRHQLPEMSNGQLFLYFFQIIGMKGLAGIILPEALIRKFLPGQLMYIPGNPDSTNGALFHINPVYGKEKIIQGTDYFLVQLLQFFFFPPHDRGVRHILMVTSQAYHMGKRLIGNTAAPHIYLSKLRMIPGILHFCPSLPGHFLHTGVHYRIIFLLYPVIPVLIALLRRCFLLQSEEFHHGLIGKHTRRSAVLQLDNP